MDASAIIAGASGLALGSMSTALVLGAKIERSITLFEGLATRVTRLEAAQDRAT